MASSGTYNDRTLQPRRAGPPPARLGVQDDGADRGDPQGRRPRLDHATSRKPLELKIPGYGDVERQDLRQHLRRQRWTSSRATLKSDNSVYAQLDLDLGPKKVCETAKLLGITTKLDGFPAEGLGGLRLGVSPLEMARAYATLATGGMRHKPTAIKKVEFRDGKTDDLGKLARASA